MQETKDVITKDMMIGDVVMKYPQIIDTLSGYGLHCVGCQVNTMESLEQGSLGHGMPEETFKEMLAKVNEVAMNTPKETQEEVKNITLTKNAVKKVKEILSKEDSEKQGLRVGVIAGGCSGLSYNLSFDEKKDTDEVLEFDGLNVFIDKEHLEMLSGVEIDFLENLNESGFKISNPSAKSTCGCGNSFS
tara:strand:+ start:39790 stop:40356 length:567 start_codon:yes stop_codon:yes gene_type:complete